MKILPITVLLTLGLTGCNLYKDYSRPEGLPVTDLYSDSTMMRADTLSSLGNVPWRDLFSDAHLQNLIDEALDNNTDLQVAMLRIDEANAALSAAKLAFYPSVALQPDVSVSSIGGKSPTTTYQIPVNVSWEVDLFGKLRNAKKEQQMLLLQQSAYARSVRSSLIASVANAYYALLMLDSQIDISAQTIEVWREQVRTMELQFKVGGVRENALTQAQANLEGLLSTHNTLRR